MIWSNLSSYKKYRVNVSINDTWLSLQENGKMNSRKTEGLFLLVSKWAMTKENFLLFVVKDRKEKIAEFNSFNYLNRSKSETLFFYMNWRILKSHIFTVFSWIIPIVRSVSDFAFLLTFPLALIDRLKFFESYLFGEPIRATNLNFNISNFNKNWCHRHRLRIILDK